MRRFCGSRKGGTREMSGVPPTRGGHSHMRHINGCNRGHSVVTGSPKTFGCGHRVTEGFWCGHRVTEHFWVWSRGHRTLLGVVTGSPKDIWCGHRITKVFQHCCMGSQSSAVQSRVKELHTYIQWCHECLVHQLRMLCRSLYYTRH